MGAGKIVVKQVRMNRNRVETFAAILRDNKDPA
jgi:hypothetical protein